MELNKLYFLKNEFFEKYGSSVVLNNKTRDLIGEHSRPYYYAFSEGDILWMIPISSQCSKYEREYDKALKKYGICDGLEFVYVKGNKNVALIQNMIPIRMEYVEKVYKYHGTEVKIEINEKKRKEINAKARKVVRLARIGKKLTFTPILELENSLLQDTIQLNTCKNKED